MSALGTLWPLSAAEVARLCTAKEHPTVERKRSWYPLDSASGKGAFIKDTLTLANSVSADRLGILLIGVGDDVDGGHIIGTSDTPSEEQLQQILGAYTQPVPHLRSMSIVLEGKTVDVLGVLYSTHRPHWATRELPGLTTDTIYLRRGSTNGRATMVEIEALFRDKSARLGDLPMQRESIEAGFVETGSWNGLSLATVRVTNLSDEPVSDVLLLLDSSLPYNAAYFTRQQLWGPGRMNPRQSVELPIKIDTQRFFLAPLEFRQAGGSLPLGYRWMTLTLHVRYRGPSGYFRVFDRRLDVTDS
jgi:hypothetical protein